jgi:hypothetical protein
MSEPHTPTALPTDRPTDNYFNQLEIKHENDSRNVSNANLFTGASNYNSTSISKNTTPQMSTVGILHNLSGLQTTTNTKLDILTDAIYGLTRSIDRMHKEQLKQTDLLIAISRNTSNMTMGVSSAIPGTPMNMKNTNIKVKDYGFTDRIDVMSNLILRLIKQVEIQITNRRIQYKSTRDLTITIMKQVVKIAVSKSFKVNGEIEPPLNLPDNKAQSTMKVASKLGTIDGTIPVLTPEAFRELFDDIDCRVFTVLVEKVIERLCIIRALLPYYEADILCAISYPYFYSDGQVICDWNALKPRSETINETKAMSATLTDRDKLASMLAKGVREQAAVRAIFKNI